MKNTAKLVLKGLLVIVLFTGSSVALSSIGVKSVCEANAAVSYQQVYQYLVNHGYTVITLNPVSGTKTLNWTAHTILNNVEFTSTIYVTGNEIVVVVDNPM